MAKKKRYWFFGEWFDRKDAAKRRAKEYGPGYETEIRPAPKASGWKWGLYYRKKK